MPVRIVDSRHGRMMVEENDQYVGRSLIELGEYSEGQVALFRNLVSKDMVVVEVGANIGALTVPLARMAQEVHAFECQRHAFHMLCGNVAMNELRNVRCYHLAAGAESKMIDVPVMDASVATNLGAFSVDMPGERMDRVRMVKVEIPCHFLKIDVEGYEAEVLKGAEAMIRDCRPFIYLENDRAEKSDALIDQVRSMGYVPYWHVSLLQGETNFNGCQRDIFGCCASFDMLCVLEGVEVSGGQEAKPGDLQRMNRDAIQEAA